MNNESIQCITGGPKNFWSREHAADDDRLIRLFEIRTNGNDRTVCFSRLVRRRRALSSDWLRGMAAARSLAITRVNEPANQNGSWAFSRPIRSREVNRASHTVSVFLSSNRLHLH